VFASELRAVSYPEAATEFSIIWLRLPDGWIPLERFEQINPSTELFTPVVRPYSPIVSTKTLLGEAISVSSSESSHAEGSGILPRRAAATPEQQQRSPNTHRSRDTSSRRDSSSRHGIRTRYQSSPSSISRAILKAKEDITALTQSLRETHAEQTRLTSSRVPAYAPPSPNGKSTPSDRIARLLAMQQQIDVLSSSILEIQESLSGVRQGLAAALSGTSLLLHSPDISSTR
jgi:hypothetical protein